MNSSTVIFKMPCWNIIDLYFLVNVHFLAANDSWFGHDIDSSIFSSPFPSCLHIVKTNTHLICWRPADYYQGEPIRFSLMGLCYGCEMWLHRVSQRGDSFSLQLDLCLSDLRGDEWGQTHLPQSVSLPQPTYFCSLIDWVVIIAHILFLLHESNYG